MTEPARSGEAISDQLRPADGLCLLGEFQGSGFAEPRYLVRRGDGQVIQLSRLLYLVTAAIAEESADGGDSHRDASRIAARVAAGFGREVSADNIRYLVAGKLAPLGLVTSGHRAPGEPGPATDADTAHEPPPRMNLLLALRVRGVLLRPRAVNAVGQALAWLHYPVLVVLVLAGFAAFEVWLFAVHGAIGPLLGILQRPVLFLAVAGLTLLSLLIHEFGHASACRYGGARPGVIGFGLYLVWPSLYTDVTDAYRLGRAGRLRTDLGGVYFNAIFILALSACYAATGEPVYLAAAFLDNFQILQQLVPLVRMDGYFIIGDLAGLPDLLGLVGPIMASLLPGAAGRRAGARARDLRRGPRILVTAWVLVAVPLLAAVAGYTILHLPAIVATAARSFAAGLAAVRAGFAAGHPGAALAAILSVVLLVIPVAGLLYLLVRIAARGAAMAARQTTRLRSRRHRPPCPAGMRSGAARGWRQTSRRRRFTVVLCGLGVLSAAGGVALGVAAAARPANLAPGGPAGPAAAAYRLSAAAWVARQVSPAVTVSCDPQMCGQVQRQGFPAARLLSLRSDRGSPLASSVVVATPALRARFGRRLETAYAPVLLARFGSGSGQVDVLAVAPGGAAAARSQLAAADASRAAAGKQLLHNTDLQVSPAARGSLVAGHVDSRLLAALSVLAGEMPIRVTAFDGAAPGASSATVPLRGAEISSGSPAALSQIVAFLHAQRAPYLPAVAAITQSTGGRSVVTVRFDALGLSGAGALLTAHDSLAAGKDAQ